MTSLHHHYHSSLNSNNRVIWTCHIICVTVAHTTIPHEKLQSLNIKARTRTLVSKLVVQHDIPTSNVSMFQRLVVLLQIRLNKHHVFVFLKSTQFVIITIS